IRRLRRAPGSTLFPYTTLFRSGGRREGGAAVHPLARWRRRRERASALAARGRAGSAAPRRLSPLDCVVAALAGPFRLRRILQLRSEEHTSELQSRENLVCRLLL